MLIQIYEAQSYFNDYWVGVVKYGQGFIDHEILISCVTPDNLMN